MTHVFPNVQLCTYIVLIHRYAYQAIYHGLPVACCIEGPL